MTNVNWSHRIWCSIAGEALRLIEPALFMLWHGMRAWSVVHMPRTVFDNIHVRRRCGANAMTIYSADSIIHLALCCWLVCLVWCVWLYLSRQCVVLPCSYYYNFNNPLIFQLIQFGEAPSTYGSNRLCKQCTALPERFHYFIKAFVFLADVIIESSMTHLDISEWKAFSKFYTSAAMTWIY